MPGRAVTVHVAEHAITIELGGDDIRTVRRTTTLLLGHAAAAVRAP